MSLPTDHVLNRFIYGRNDIIVIFNEGTLKIVKKIKNLKKKIPKKKNFFFLNFQYFCLLLVSGTRLHHYFELMLPELSNLNSAPLVCLKKKSYVCNAGLAYSETQQQRRNLII